MTRDDVLALSDERDRQLALRLAAWRDGWRACELACRDAIEAAYWQGVNDADREWHAALAPAREAARRSARTPSHAELEQRRWGPGGRSRYGDPRPDDYQGKGAA